MYLRCSNEGAQPRATRARSSLSQRPIHDTTRHDTLNGLWADHPSNQASNQRAQHRQHHQHWQARYDRTNNERKRRCRRVAAAESLRNTTQFGAFALSRKCRC